MSNDPFFEALDKASKEASEGRQRDTEAAKREQEEQRSKVAKFNSAIAIFEQALKRCGARIDGAWTTSINGAFTLTPAKKRPMPFAMGVAMFFYHPKETSLWKQERAIFVGAGDHSGRIGLAGGRLPVQGSPAAPP